MEAFIRPTQEATPGAFIRPTPLFGGSVSLGLSGEPLGLSGKPLGLSGENLGLSGETLGLSGEPLGLSGEPLGCPANPGLSGAPPESTFDVV